ncbi:MAG: RloB family protein [Mariprofundaceae bacterium]|nr:RloB family protein [Mariprofundaceae bacterium]
MILTNRLFEREAPSVEAKLIIIFCEGKKREPHYFNFFSEMSSQIRFEIVPAEQHGNNSPTGLYKTATTKLIKSDKNPSPEYELEDGDEVWFAIDTDTWNNKIDELRSNCKGHDNWNVAQSNPCFEVWLYWHLSGTPPSFEGMDESKCWKSHLNKMDRGGFDSRKHPILIEDAIQNSTNFHRKIENGIAIGCTEIYMLANSFYPLVAEKIKAVRNSLFSDN